MSACAGNPGNGCSMHARLAAGMLAAALLWASPSMASAPQKVMSLNLCADVLLLHLADRQQIASLTFLAATSPLSPVKALAHELPYNHGSVEEVIMTDPDLVLVHRYSDTAVRQALERLGYTLWQVEAPATLEAAARQITALGKRLGQPQRGRQLAAKITDLPDMPAEAGPVVAVYGPNGMTTGPGSLLHDLIRRNGLTNFAARHRLPETGRIPLELLLSEPPDALVLSGEQQQRRDTLAQQSLMHPALQSLAARRPTAHIPGRLWSCGGPELIEAQQRLQGLRKEMASRETVHE